MIGSLASLLDSAQGSILNAGGSVRDMINIGFGSLGELIGDAPTEA